MCPAPLTTCSTLPRMLSRSRSDLRLNTILSPSPAMMGHKAQLCENVH